MKEENLAKVLLETILENHGVVRSCPVEYLGEKNKWIFWDETWTKSSREYDTIDGVLSGLRAYCEELELENRGNTA